MKQETLKTIITDPKGAETLVKEADELGEKFKNQGISTSQIRAIFGEVRKIESIWQIDAENRQKALRRFILLKPKMAYRGEKENKVKPLMEVLRPAVDLVIAETDLAKQDANFRRFVEFFEAILAYHKAYGGK